MAQSAALLSRLMASSVTAVARAGKIIQDVLSEGELKIVEKGKNDLQTEADRSAERCIIASLSRKFPDVKIIGEEGNSKCEVPSDWIVTDMDSELLGVQLPQHLEQVSSKDICIWIDPLDGTSEYTQGLVEHVTVLIGIAVKEKAVGGVIYQPFYKNKDNNTLGRTIWGIDGVGVGGNFKVVAPPEGKRIITTTRSHSDGAVEDALRAMEADEILRVGGAGHKVLLLLEGRAHAYVFASRGCKKWDTCGPEAVLRAAGGVLTNLFGDNYSYHSKVEFPNKGGVLATAPGQQHQWYLKRISDEVKQKLL